MPPERDPERPVALVTGGSAGLGAELADLLARDGYPVVLVARREAELARVAAGLRARHGATVETIVADLSQPEAAAAVVDALRDRGLRVGVLVNNAGFGGSGPFATSDRDHELAMIAVNVVALTHLTKLLLPPMVAAGQGRILNVASTAAFQPGPLMAVYFATKAYVLSFSEAIAAELRGSGVTVTALCPGPTATGFAARSGMGDSRLFQGAGVGDARRVAAAGYAGMRAGKAIVVPGRGNWALTQAVRVLPRGLLARTMRRAMERTDS